MSRQPRKRIAIIGAGVTGLGAAYALKDKADIVLFNDQPRLGGHAWTVDVDYDGARVPVDIGFICFNRPNYPNLTAMLRHLDVRTHWTDMAFSVSDPNGYEWSSDPWGLFAWKRNASDPRFLGMVREIIHFNNLARDKLKRGLVPACSLGDWLDEHAFSELFRTAYLLPMGAAIWSTPEREMMDYPADSLIQFFDNHRLMHLIRPIWRTVAGGSRAYVEKLEDALLNNIRAGHAVENVRPLASGRVQVTAKGRAPDVFDDVIFACHANQSLKMLDPRFERQCAALRSIKFSANTAYLHRDPALMPQRRMAWASWNVRKGDDGRVCVTYWMNRLQRLPSGKRLFVTLNPVNEPAEDKTFGVYEFEHPMYDGPSAAARREIQRLQGRDGLYFAGAWLGDGFHEAGLRTGLEAAYALGGEVPWTPTLIQHHSPQRDRMRMETSWPPAEMIAG